LFSFSSSYLSSTRHPRTLLFMAHASHSRMLTSSAYLTPQSRRSSVKLRARQVARLIYLAFRYAIALFNLECRGSASKQRKEERERAQAFPHRTAITAGLPTLKASLVTGTTTAINARCPRRVMPREDFLRAAQHGLHFDRDAAAEKAFASYRRPCVSANAICLLRNGTA
jgi:hypothetical protein